MWEIVAAMIITHRKEFQNSISANPKNTQQQRTNIWQHQ
jgi:hypothetical protein